MPDDAIKRPVEQLCAKSPTLTFAVLVNGDLNQVSYEQRTVEFARLQHLPGAE